MSVIRGKIADFERRVMEFRRNENSHGHVEMNKLILALQSYLSAIQFEVSLEKITTRI